MIIPIVLSLELLRWVVAKGPKELVLVQDLTADHDKRNLDAGLPSVITFNLVRESGNITLTLTENRRLDLNAPVYEGREEQQGQITLDRQESLPIKDIQFYQDKTNMGVFSVQCHVSTEGPCTRKMTVKGSYLCSTWLVDGVSPSVFRCTSTCHGSATRYRSEMEMQTGNLYIDGRNFDIEPAPAPDTDDISRRDVKNFKSFGTPHLLHENEATDHFKRATFISDAIYDADAVADDELLNGGVLEDDLDGIGKNDDTRQYNSGPGTNRYVVEILIVLDYSVWKYYYDITDASGTMTRAEATDLRLRKHFSLIIMGVSLRYETIDDPELNIYCTISGFIIYKSRDGSNPLPPGREVLIDGKWHADASAYIMGLGTTGWIGSLKSRKNLPASDHIMIFTAYELYDEETGDDAVEGLAYLGGVCYPTRVSVNEIGSFFSTTSVATHELGHNLGADHDGDDSAWRCYRPGNYIMAPYLAEFDEDTVYSVNPWRFSECSVKAFKNTTKRLDQYRKNCLTNPVDVSAHEEFQKHASKLPGELHSANAQCQLLHGEQSRLCKGTNMTNICLVMNCLRPDGKCVPYAAARGTTCKGPGVDKYYWCIDGACVEKELTEPAPATPDNSTTTEDEDCVDEGLYTFNCTVLRGWYEKLSDFCSEGYSQYCCKTCSLLQTDDCVDYGIGGFSCGEIFSNAKYFTAYHPSFCENWGSECCETCSIQGILYPVKTFCTVASTTTTTTSTAAPLSGRCLDCPGDVGYDGLSCEKLRQILGSKGKVCQYYPQECCDTCASICNGNKKGIKIFKKTYSCAYVLRVFFFGHINSFCRIYAKPCCKTCTTS